MMTEGDTKWIAVAESASLMEGQMKACHVNGQSFALYRVDGKVYATGNICTHGQAFLTDGWLDGHIIECPLHGGRFDICTGKGQGAPIDCDLNVYTAVEENGEIRIAL